MSSSGMQNTHENKIKKWNELPTFTPRFLLEICLPHLVLPYKEVIYIKLQSRNHLMMLLI